jgi:membrane associated rhomboid family serine protease
MVVAYLILYPRVKIWILAFGRIPLRIPAYIVLALWILIQFVMFGAGGEDQISWACHVGGILTGAGLVLILRRRNVPLMDEVVMMPHTVEQDQQGVAQPIETRPAPRWGRQ